MAVTPRQALHCCWVVDPWDRRRTGILDAWGGAVGSVPTLWHAGQLETGPDTDVQLRSVEEALNSPVSQELGLPEVWAYEIKHRSHAVCADLFRYLATYLYGGVYFDLDVLPSPLVETDLWDNEDWANLVVNSESPLMEIRVIRAREPGHPEVKKLLQTAIENTQRFIAEGGYKRHGYRPYDIVYRTGPRMASLVLFGDASRAPDALTIFFGPRGKEEKKFHQTVHPLVKRQSEAQFRHTNLGSRKAEVLAIARADED
ncbi:MAG: hypothetical protein GY772_29515 [bacterium]|nr:hypothetical protein [bacterium]